MSDSNGNPQPTTALLVIDAQESFRHRPYFDARELATYLKAQNALIEGSVAAGLPVVRILHVEPEGVFALVSGFVVPLTGLADYAPATTVYKHRHSALAGTDLAAWLTERGIRRVIVSGHPHRAVLRNHHPGGQRRRLRGRFRDRRHPYLHHAARERTHLFHGGDPRAHRAGARRPLRPRLHGRGSARTGRRAGRCVRASLRREISCAGPRVVVRYPLPNDRRGYP